MALSSRMLAVACAVLVAGVMCDDYTHKYEDGEQVVLWANKVGPYHNPQETYNYYSLPYCTLDSVDPADLERKFAGLGEVLEGNELVNSGLQFPFKGKADVTKICEKAIDKEDEEVLEYAVRNQYWGQLYMDELPMWHMLGEVREDDGGGAFLYTHLKFEIGYNQNQVIEVNLTAENPQLVKSGSILSFTYSVEWASTDIPFHRRFHRYLDFSFFEHQIHWFSIFNSFMMVIFLTGLVSVILMRTLHNDYARYSKQDEQDEIGEFSDEYGWKLVHRDVFRPPTQLSGFCALVGTGNQLLVLVLVVIMIAIVGTLYSGRGAIATAVIVCYAFTSMVGGFVSGGLYARSGGTQWIKTMVLTAIFFPGVVMILGFMLNLVAIAYSSLAAVPFGTMVVMALLWALVSVPLSALGTILGRNWNGAPDPNLSHVSTIPRPIPERKWYVTPSIVILAGGILPFGSIFIELYFVFTSFWNYKFYYVYGFMLLVYVILMIVSVCVTIVSTYFLLNAEDYRWQWNSFLSSASTALYVYGYAVYYFIYKTHMSGLMQTCFYFGYMFVFCVGLGVMTGAIGFIGSSLFVNRIYSYIKSD